MTILAGTLRYALINVFEAVWWDEAVYMGLARSLYESFAFTFPFGLERFRPILLPIILSPTYHFKSPELLARAEVLVFSAISIPAIYYLGRTLYSWKTGLLASLFLATNSLFILHGQRILAESMYITFSSLATALFYKGIENDKSLLMPAAFFTGLAALTKNFGFFLPLLYLAYTIFGGRLNRIKLRTASFCMLIFLATLSPNFYFSWVNYGNPLGTFIDQLQNVPPATSYPYFYLQRFAVVFSWNSFFILAGLILAVRKRSSQDIFLLAITLLPMLLLNTVFYFHMEERYIIPFMPAFLVGGGSVADRLRKVDRKILVAIALLALVFSSVSLKEGYEMIVNDSQTNGTLKQACIYLKEITRESEVVASPSYPFVYYYAERPTVKPPDDRRLLYNVLESLEVRYVLIHYPEPDNPPYLAEEIQNGKFIKIKGFQDSSGVELTAIYQYIG